MDHVRAFTRILKHPITETYTLKHRAHLLVQRAVKAGWLVPSSTCDVCHKPPQPTRTGKPPRQFHAHHHHGYDDGHALDVQWLCQPCHMKVHNMGANHLSPERRSEIAHIAGQAAREKYTTEERSARQRLAASKMSFEARSAAGKRGGAMTGHLRWHVARGKISSKCSLCKP